MFERVKVSFGMARDKIVDSIAVGSSIYRDSIDVLARKEIEHAGELADERRSCDEVIETQRGRFVNAYGELQRAMHEHLGLMLTGQPLGDFERLTGFIPDIVKAYGTAVRDAEESQLREDQVHKQFIPAVLSAFAHNLPRFSRAPLVVYDSGDVSYVSPMLEKRYDLSEARLLEIFENPRLVNSLNKKDRVRQKFGNFDLIFHRYNITDDSYIDAAYLVPRGGKRSRRKVFTRWGERAFGFIDNLVERRKRDLQLQYG